MSTSLINGSTPREVANAQQQTLSATDQAFLRFGVRPSRRVNAPAGEFELMDTNPGGDKPELLYAGSKDNCDFVLDLVRKSYVKGAVYNSNRVVIDGKSYTLTKDK